MRFDRAKFFDGMRRFEGGLSQQQVNGLESLITSIENDAYVTRIEWAAYMLATVKPETGHTYQPIHEWGGRAYFIRRYGSQTRVGRRLGNDSAEEGAIYAGRGDVQLTGEDNYEKAEAALRKYYPDVVRDFEARTGRRFDLTVGDQPGDLRDPDNAQDPAIAYAIMSFGMRTGMFTTRKLSDFTKAAGFDAFNARTIINGHDNAGMIAEYYKHFLAILRASLVDETGSQRAATDESVQLEIPPIENSIKTGQVEPAQKPSEPLAPPPAGFVPEDKEINAPAKEGSTGKTAVVTIGGFAVPTFLVGIVTAIKSAITDGYIDARELGSVVISFIASNQKYVFAGLGMVVAGMMLKKLYKQITLWIAMYIAGRADMHNVTVKPQ